MSFVRKNLDELINIPTKARKVYDRNSVYDPKSEHQERHNPESAQKFTADPRSTVFSKSANPLDLPLKSTIRALFIRLNPPILKPIHPPQVSTFLYILEGIPREVLLRLNSHAYLEP